MSPQLNRRDFLRATVAAGVGGSFLAGSSCVSAAEPPREIGLESQLFLDDWLVDRVEGLKRVLHRPQKQGLIKTMNGLDWDAGSVYLGNLVCRDAQGRFHMAYRYSWWDAGVRNLHPNIGDDKAHWFRETVGYATSDDGIHWQKPRLGLLDGPTRFRKIAEFPFQQPVGMSRDNNLGYPIDFGLDLHAHGNIEDPARKFLLRTVTLDDTHPFAKTISSQLYYARDWPDVVKDGDWKKKLTPIADGRLSPRGFKSLAGYDQAAGEWFSVSQNTIGNWVKENGRNIARYSTKDLVHWEGPTTALAVAADESREIKDHVEYMDLLAYRVGGAQSGAWLGQLVIFHSDRSNPQYSMPGRTNVWRKGTTELRLVVSRDAGKSWQRVADRSVWLPCHPDPRGYDRLVFASHPVRVGDEAWIYYCAWDGDHLVFNQDGSLFEPGFLRSHRVARATFRWNGYVSLDADRTHGTLLTRPFRLAGDHLLVNLSASSGQLSVRIMDEKGEPIEGFASATSVSGRDGVELPVEWKGDQALRSLQGRVVRLKFDVLNASLFGFRVAT